MASEALVLTGPTATGKTDLSLAVAERLGGEIISMDSRQVFRDMEIGTAKATPAQRARAPHHGLDLVDPDERYSAGRFAADARRWIAEIRGRGQVPILVGGTGFFLRALTHPLFREPALPAERRAALEAFLRERPTPELSRWLGALDPAGASAFERWGGRQRILRALEVVLLTGYPLAWWHEHSPAGEPPLDPLVFVLDLPRPELYRRIEERVLAMIDAGLVAEVEGLLARGFGPDAPGMSATGYAEMIPFLRGKRTLEQAIDDIQRATRRYARRQLTWFRNQLPPGAVWLDATRPPAELVQEIVQRWEAQSGS
jgi:tRNA dimethylallyltransferase